MSDELVRGFTVYRNSWYAIEDKDEVMFGMYTANVAGTSGEMAMRWHILQGVSYARLECFDGSFRNLVAFSDVLEKLAKLDGQHFTPQDFSDLLLSCGFEDMTRRDSPYGGSPRGQL